ncbi:DUF5980 family protein [Nonomuraea harbinensis]|uniref:DUF5980 family protein n=1 Tax=Nonomuraea harbinensis TaxID=1286938 RepID=A0ABW1C1C8_9ACTN|nr:DUF5980 family protein [Nonomuraea harbinensis]
MKISHRAARAALGATAGLAIALAGSTPASAATWDLMGENQICIQRGHSYWTYFVAAVVGSWSSPVHVTVENLPPGAVVTQADEIPPGSNHTSSNGSTTINGWVFAEFDPLPIGVYTAQLTASDGTRTLSNPITISVKERCY